MKKAEIFAAIPRTDVFDTFLTPDVEQLLEEAGTVRRQEASRPLTSDELAAQAAGSSIILTGWGQTPFTEEVLDQLPDLKLIAHTAGSVASFCGPEVFERGIRVTAGNDVFAESVAEAVMAYIFAVLRKLPHYDRIMKEGGWQDGEFSNEGLFGKKVGLVGFGTIPRFLPAMMKPYRCQISAYDPLVSETDMAPYGVRKCGLEECFAENDIVSLHLPKKEDTIGLVGEKLLGLMRPGALLVNTARGAIIDEDSLIAALKDGRIRAALDVYTEEPLDPESELRKCPNTLLIPHMAGPTLDRRKDAALSVVEDIIRFLSGQELQHEIKAGKAAQMSR